MKTKLKNFTLIMLILLFLSLFFIYNQTFKLCILKGASLFFLNVFPTLLPMFIINDLLLNYNFGIYLNKLVGKFFFKFFKMGPMATYIFIMAIFSGTPTNAYIINNCLENNLITKDEAEVILAYAFFINPLFLYQMLNNIFHHNLITLKIISICYFSNLLIAFYFKKFKYSNTLPLKIKEETFNITLTKSIKKSLNTLLSIMGTIIFYLVLSEGINIIWPNSLINCFFNGLLEITGGLNKLAVLNVNMYFKEIVAIIFISFGGLSIHSQIKGIIPNDISYKTFLEARIWQVILATSIYIICT